MFRKNCPFTQGTAMEPELPQISRREAVAAVVVGGSLFASTWTRAGEEPLAITGPRKHQVIQRRHYKPEAGRFDEERPLDFGSANVAVTFTCRLVEAKEFVLTVTRISGDFGPGKPLQKKFPREGTAANIQLAIEVPAGGWYRLEVESLDATGKSLAKSAVEPFGVGEVFLIAGQSYAGNHNDELLKVADEHQRVVACDTAAKSWQVAHDPQPTTTGAAGSVWPALGDLLVPIVQTPIGFVNVSVGATATRQWLPGDALFERLLTGIAAAGHVRAVLWQQGESDVIEKTPTDTYVERMKKIRSAFAEKTKCEAPWLLAKSTLHPTVYRQPVEEGAIRAAIDQLWREAGFAVGPDTDILAGENRGDPKSQRHFSAIGQRRAAQMWFAAIWTELNRVASS